MAACASRGSSMGCTASRQAAREARSRASRCVAFPSNFDARARSARRDTMGGLAICMTGLERTYPEIAGNIDEAVLRMTPRPRLFGVRPTGHWPRVQQLHFEAIEDQRPPCWQPSRIPFGRYYPLRAVDGFIRELCDLDHCEQMISAYEQRTGSSFEAVARVRLDLFWETPLQMPKAIGPDDVFVPWMSHCMGRCDKFALGGRSGMRKYLTRVRWLDGRHNFSGRVNSEVFLRRVGVLTGVNFKVEASWMFCKFGYNKSASAAGLSQSAETSMSTSNRTKPTPFRGWPECTHRIRARIRCTHFFCDWCGKGCRCISPDCAAKHERLGWCFRPDAATGKGTYSTRAGRVLATGQLMLH